ncbi:MAG: MmcQ/YjbR family DNA-binding protein [Bacteroidota bacterium]
MNIAEFRNTYISKKGVTEDFLFDKETLTFKVKGEIFAITHLDSFESISSGMWSGKAVEIRERYAAVKPGYHKSKKHWNTALIDGNIPDDLLCRG